MTCPYTGDTTTDTTTSQARDTSGGAFHRGGKKETLARADEGFFGPGSVAWKVWTFPASALQGFFRAVTIEHLDPDLVAAIDASGQVIKRMPLRYDRTMEYFAATLFADAETVTRMSDILMKVHDRSYGVNPVTGNDYEANKPSSQLWILVTAWHSILYVYETFGPGKLSRDEETEYWSQMAIAAQFQPIDPADVPRSRGEVQKYFDDWREKISASEAAVHNIDEILNAFTNAFTGLPRPLQVIARPFFRRSVIATYPRWMRPMMGLKQSRVTDTAIVALWRPVLAVIHRFPKLMTLLVGIIAPRAERYVTPAVMKIPAASPRVYTPEVARRMFGNPLTPLEQREELLGKRRRGEGQRAYGHNHTDTVLEFQAAESAEATEETLYSDGFKVG